MAIYYKNPYFLTLVAFAIWGCGYITADDARIEKENALNCHLSQSNSQDKSIKLAVREDR